MRTGRRRTPRLSLHPQPCSRPAACCKLVRTGPCRAPCNAPLPAAQLTSARSLTLRLSLSVLPVCFMPVSIPCPCKEGEQPFLRAPGWLACRCSPVKARILLRALHWVRSAAARPGPHRRDAFGEQSLQGASAGNKTSKFPFTEAAKPERPKIRRRSGMAIPRPQPRCVPPTGQPS